MFFEVGTVETCTSPKSQDSGLMTNLKRLDDLAHIPMSLDNLRA
jgi:hypothetical protein